MNCAVCGVDLVLADRHRVEIDHYPTCRGAWLDRGRLALARRRDLLANAGEQRCLGSPAHATALECQALEQLRQVITLRGEARPRAAVLPGRSAAPWRALLTYDQDELGETVEEGRPDGGESG
jgi:Zn-finger nucleic acid-binding protein